MLKIEGSRIIQLAVGMAVGIILIVGLIWPVVDDSTDEITTKHNNTSINYLLTDDSVSLDYEIINGELYLNDEKIALSGQVNVQGITDRLAFAHAPTWSKIYVSDTKNNIYSTDISSISFSNGSFSYTSNAVEYTGTMGGITLMPSNDGNYGAFFGSDVVNVSVGDAVYFVNVSTTIKTSSDESHKLFSLSHMVDGVIQNDYAFIYDGTTFNEVDLTATYNGSISEGNGYYTYTGASVTYSVQGYADLTSSSQGILAPIEYSEITDMDSNIRTMIGVAGMLIVVLMVVMVARNLMD